jgi:hypothetical protein
MADIATFSLDGAQLDAASDRLVRRYLTAGADAVRTVTKRLERSLEEQTRSAVPGRLWRAWASNVFPKSGPAQNPAGSVFVNGKPGGRTAGAMAFWTQPGAIRGKRGQYLAIPLPSAGSRGRARDLTPGEWERANGIKLQFLYRQGKPSLLVAIGGTTNGRTGTFRPLTGGSRGRAAQGRGGPDRLNNSVVPIFVLLPVVPFRNAFAIQPTIAAAQAELPQEFFARLR